MASSLEPLDARLGAASGPPRCAWRRSPASSVLRAAPARRRTPAAGALSVAGRTPASSTAAARGHAQPEERHRGNGLSPHRHRLTPPRHADRHDGRRRLRGDAEAQGGIRRSPAWPAARARPKLGQLRGADLARLEVQLHAGALVRVALVVEIVDQRLGVAAQCLRPASRGSNASSVSFFMVMRDLRPHRASRHRAVAPRSRRSTESPW